MIRTPRYALSVFLLLFSFGPQAQVKAPAPYGALPSERQLAWQELDMYVLVHFTPTTFENKEWGYGDADPKIFNPSDFSAEQIVTAAKAGGFKGLIFVSKHHDGFCLWPSATTPYNISKSPWKNGQGDMVGEFAKACKAEGLKFGVYCSPWDRNNPAYGTYEYIKTYRAQLKELYTRYGPLFMSWHDGANGGDGYYGGKRETRNIDRSTYYGWDTTWSQLTRKLQPTANIFSDAGWDVRWVGNEDGAAEGESWATFTPKPAPGGTLVGPGMVDYSESPTGTRNGKYWMPAECDVALRPGWFYHPEQDDKVKTPEKLFDLYLKSVGRGACLDLGLSPDKRGRLHDNDVAALKGFGEMLKRTFARDLAREALITPSSIRGNDVRNYAVSHLTDGDRYSYWAVNDEIRQADLVLEWKEPVEFDLLRLRENIRLGQRVTSVQVDDWVNGQWSQVARGTSVGACRILTFDKAIRTTKIRIRLESTDACPVISEVGIFKKARP
jgi:alpha-L-fucosidase